MVSSTMMQYPDDLSGTERSAGQVMNLEAQMPKDYLFQRSRYCEAASLNMC